jgi:RNA polymerase sigma factor FliA
METAVERWWNAFRQLRDAAARERLVEHYMPLARIIAAKLYGMRIDDSSTFDDYLQFARIGLIESVDRYDTARSASFETYSSYRIRGAILNGIQQASEAASQRTFWRARAQARLESLAENLRTPIEQASLRELADVTLDLALGLILDAVEQIVDEDPRANPYAVTELVHFARRIQDLLEQLPARERDIVRSHYFEQVEFQELADRYGVTKGRISQLHARALERLREMLRESPRLDRRV